MLYKEIPLSVRGSADYAKLCVYIQDAYPEMPYGRQRKLVLICPGGAYYFTSNREAEVIALRMLSMGCHAAVLRYSVAPARYPTSLLEVARSVALIRENAADWHVDPDKIVLMGFSAGGHLAASYGVFWREDFIRQALGAEREMLRPNGMILCYPVISSKEGLWHEDSFRNLLGEALCDSTLREKMSLENQVNEDTPRCFIWHTLTDELVPAENALIFAGALAAHRIPVELHLYETGPHSLSLSTEQTNEPDKNLCTPECRSWIGLLETWLENV